MTEELTEREIRVVQHTLGLMNSDEAHRNRFIASEGHEDYDALESLVDKGYMKKAYSEDETMLVGDMFVVVDDRLEALGIDKEELS